MEIFEEVKFHKAYSIHHVIQLANKYGDFKTLLETNQDPANAVIVGKIRTTFRLSTDLKYKHILLKEVLKNGTYGKRFRLIAQGALAESLESAKVEGGDRLLLIKPNIVSRTIYKNQEDNLDDLEVSFMEPFSKNQKLILIRKRLNEMKNKSSSTLNVENHITDNIQTKSKATTQTTNEGNNKLLTEYQRVSSLPSCSRWDGNNKEQSADVIVDGISSRQSKVSADKGSDKVSTRSQKGQTADVIVEVTSSQQSEVPTNKTSDMQSLKDQSLPSCSKLDDSEAQSTNDFIQSTSSSQKKIFTEGFSRSNSAAYIQGPKVLRVWDPNQRVSKKTNYVYKKIADITAPGKGINVFFVVSHILKVIKGEESKKSIVVVKAVDETCVDQQHLVISLMFAASEKLEGLIKPFTIVRAHRMMVERQNGILEGRVFNAYDVLIFPNKRKSTAVTSAKSFTFCDEDEVRLSVISTWLKNEYLPFRIYRAVEWFTLDSMKSQRMFQLHCRVNGITMNSQSNTLVLNITDGTCCPLKVYQVPANVSNYDVTPTHCKGNLRNVDVLVDKPCESVLKVKKGDFIVLGPIVLTECGTDSDGCKYHCLKLQGDGHCIQLLDSLDPVLKKIVERIDKIPEHYSLQSADNISPRNDGSKQIKRKLFNIEDNFEFNEKRKKTDEDDICEISQIEENNNHEKENSSPLGLINNNEPSQDQNSLNSVKECASEIKTVYDKNKGANEKFNIENTKLSNIFAQMKSKRIDQMSKDSVDQCFMHLQSLLDKNANKGQDGSEQKTLLKEDGHNIETEENKRRSKSPSSEVEIIGETVNTNSAERRDVVNKIFTPDTTNTDESSTGIRANQLVMKIVQISPGQKSGVVVKDNFVQVNVDHNGQLEGGENVTLMSLLKDYNAQPLITSTPLAKSKTQSKSNNRLKLSDEESCIFIDEQNESINMHSCANDNNDSNSTSSSQNDVVTVINEKLQNKSVLPVSSYCSRQDTLISVENWLNEAVFESTDDMDSQSCTQSGQNKEDDTLHLTKCVSDIRVFVLEVQPYHKENPLDVTSGFCHSSCKKLYLFSTLMVSSSDIPICPGCHMINGEENEVEIMFALLLTVMDLEGFVMKTLLMRESAEEFLGCSVANFVQSESHRTEVIKFLNGIKCNAGATRVPLLNICVTRQNSHLVVWKSKLQQHQNDVL